MIKEEKGITLIALVITIIILIILAMISIGAITGESGILINTELAADEYKREKGMEQIQLVLGDDTIERSITGDALTIDRLVDIFNTKDWVEKAYKAGEDTLRIINNEGYIYDIIIDENGKTKIEYVGKNKEPIIKEIVVVNKDTNSIEIEVQLEIVNEGEKYTYTYWYKKEGEEEYKKAGESENNTYKFEKLEADVIYNIKVEVEDGKGLKTEGTVNVLTGKLPEGVITFEDITWGNGKASVTINTSETGYILQYQIDSKEGEWIEISNGGTIGDLSNGQTVYGRLWDGINATKDPASVEIKDEEGPTVGLTVGNITTNSIALTVTATDGETGLATEGTYKYYIGNELKETLTTNSYTYTGLSRNTSYEIKVEVADKAGNKGIATQTVTTLNNVAPVIESVTLASKTTTSLKVQAKATDVNADNLVYKLYINNNLEKTSGEVAAGESVTLEVTGLTTYTDYNYYVEVTDQIESATSGVATVRTYCSGTTNSCSSAWRCSSASSYSCGGGSSYTCVDMFVGSCGGGDLLPNGSYTTCLCGLNIR